MKRKIMARALALALALSLSLAVPSFAAEGTKTFSDVPENNWAYPYVSKAAEKGWVSGYSDGRFGPGDKVSYAQLAVMLTQAFYRDTVEAYQGAAGEAWYIRYTSVANSLGLFRGTNLEGRYTDGAAVGAQVSRYEMGQVLYNVMAAVGVTANVDHVATAASTGDWATIPVQYRDAVSAVKAAGLISGTDSTGKFGGDGLMNRAQAAVVLCNLDGLIESSQQTPPVTPDSDPEPTTIVGQEADELLFSKEHVRFYYTGWEKNASGYEVKLRIENDSDYKIDGRILSDSQAKNQKVYMTLTCATDPGRTSEGKITILNEDLQKAGLDDFKTIKVRFGVHDTQYLPYKLDFETGDIMIELNSESTSQTSPGTSIKGRSASSTVYVSQRSNTVHSVNDCGGMKNYRTMTLGDADSRGYKYCPNCW